MIFDVDAILQQIASVTPTTDSNRAWVVLSECFSADGMLGTDNAQPFGSDGVHGVFSNAQKALYYIVEQLGLTPEDLPTEIEQLVDIQIDGEDVTLTLEDMDEQGQTIRYCITWSVIDAGPRK